MNEWKNEEDKQPVVAAAANQTTTEQVITKLLYDSKKGEANHKLHSNFYCQGFASHSITLKQGLCALRFLRLV